MNIPAKEVDYKRRIGKVGGRAIYGIGTIGGLHLVVAARTGGGFETLGAGSHPGIARFIAKKASTDVIFDDIAKSDYLDPIYFQDLVPGYVQLTNQLREAQGDAATVGF